jgi:hypothetical protein
LEGVQGVERMQFSTRLLSCRPKPSRNDGEQPSKPYFGGGLAASEGGAEERYRRCSLVHSSQFYQLQSSKLLCGSTASPLPHNRSLCSPPPNSPLMAAQALSPHSAPPPRWLQHGSIHTQRQPPRRPRSAAPSHQTRSSISLLARQTSSNDTRAGTAPRGDGQRGSAED